MATKPKSKPDKPEPRHPVDTDLLYELASIACTTEEMARILGVSKSTLERHYLDVMQRGRMDCNASLRRKQYEVAMRGNVGMLIWLGKNILGQAEKFDVRGSGADGFEFVSGDNNP